MNSRRILVTGAAGFIGSNLVHFLIQETSHEIIAVDKLTYAGNLESLKAVDGHPRFRFIKADICDHEALDKIFAAHQPDGLMHLAAETHVDRSIDGPEAFIQTNVVGTYRLLVAARSYFQTLDVSAQAKFRFLHVSTDEVFGSLDVDEPAFNESTRYDPHSPYSASKASSDHLVRAWGDTYGLPILISNCSNNYGPFQFPEKLIPVVILKACRGEAIPVYGQGENVRDWLFVLDHARALEAVLVRGRAGQTYNIGGYTELRNIDLVQMLCTILDEILPVPRNLNLSVDQRKNLRSYRDLITFVLDRPGHDLRYAIDAAKIKRELGWQPLETASTGFRKTVEWYLDNEAWWSRILSGDYRLDRQGLEKVS